MKSSTRKKKKMIDKAISKANNLGWKKIIFLPFYIFFLITELMLILIYLGLNYFLDFIFFIAQQLEKVNRWYEGKENWQYTTLSKRNINSIKKDD